MNIVLVNDNAEINGGAAKIAILSARDLANRGHRIYFLCAVSPICPELIHPLINVVCSEQFEILSNPNRWGAVTQGWWNFKAESLAKDLFASLDPKETVVHLHTWAKALSTSVVRSAIEAGFTVVCTLHDFLLACPNGTLFNHSNQRICHLKPMSSLCIRTNCDTRSYGHKLWRVGRQTIQRRYGLLPDGICQYIAHSGLVVEIMKPYLPPNVPIHYVPPYIESTKEPPASPAEHQNFLYLGRIVREKGVLMLARAAKAEKVQLTFVGSGELAEQVAAIYPEVTITGWVTHKQSVEYLRNCRALVFPSLWYETFGLVVLEAASHGIPSIVPDTSAAQELVSHKETGLHFKSGDEEDLRAQIREMQDEDLAKRLGLAAYERFWSSSFASRDMHIEALEAFYSSALSQKRDNNNPQIFAANSERLHEISI